ncbi:NADH dehydrogenase subunit 6 [Bacillus mycoides]|nr:NADH dehydrogenase subunit 6 [Bacillus mycoides]
MFIMDSLPIHPLFFLLVLTMVTFFTGIKGFSKMNNWIAMLRSLATVLLTLLLSVFLTLTLIVGYALS